VMIAIRCSHGLPVSIYFASIWKTPPKLTASSPVMASARVGWWAGSKADSLHAGLGFIDSPLDPAQLPTNASPSVRLGVIVTIICKLKPSAS
jgi:hypothetical protein